MRLSELAAGERLLDLTGVEVILRNALAAISPNLIGVEPTKRSGPGSPRRWGGSSRVRKT